MDAFFEHTYFNTYYYANIVSRVLSRDFEVIGFISNFFASEDAICHLVKPFQKSSAFHSFIEHIVNEFFDHDMHEHDSKDYEYCKANSGALFTPYADFVFRNYDITGYSFEGPVNCYEDVEAYHTSLYESGILLDLYSQIAEEVFYLMFNNRVALLAFNYLMAQEVSDACIHLSSSQQYENEDDPELRGLFNKSGTLKRVKIPEWCKKAVYFRDKGKCCLCHEDLSGTLSISNQKHFDHIVPLAQGGLNDVANIQLLCSKCNLKKGKDKIGTSSLYERWF